MPMRAAVLVLLCVLAAGCTLPSFRPEAGVTYPHEVVGRDWPDLVVEIDYAPGHAPSDAATTHLLSTLRNVTGKANVVLDAKQTLNDTPNAAWSTQQLLDLETRTRRHGHEAPHALLHVLYPSGTYQPDNGPGGDVAGVTISGTRLGPVTIFLDTLRGSTCLPTPVGGLGLPLPQPPQALDRLERSTLLHEVGHAIGLVDNGIAMVRQHEDTQHPGHTPNKASVMYWSLDTCQGLRDALLQDGSIPDTFDADDRADLRSVGGR